MKTPIYAEDLLEIMDLSRSTQRINHSGGNTTTISVFDHNRFRMDLLFYIQESNERN